MPALTGAISDRIRGGLVAADPLAPRCEVDDRPSTASVRYGSGRNLSQPATRGNTRSGEGAHWR